MLYPYAKLAKHMRGIDSLVIAKMDCNINWHPRVKVSIAPLLLLSFPSLPSAFLKLVFSLDFL
jgi:protein disulfide-isomerase A1